MSHCWPVMGVSVLDRCLPRETLHPVGIRATKGPLPQARGKAPVGVRQVLGEGQGHDLAGEAGARPLQEARVPSSMWLLHRSPSADPPWSLPAFPLL